MSSREMNDSNLEPGIDSAAVVVRRNGQISVAVAAAAALVAGAFFVRGGGVSYAIGGVLLLVAVIQTWAAYDARTPLLVVDEQGARIRLGSTWRGLPWEAVSEIEHLPQRHWWRDGRLAVLPIDDESELAALDRGASWQAKITELIFGLPFSVPLGLSTRVSGVGEDLTETLADLSGGSVQVVEIDPGLAKESAEDPQDLEDAQDTQETPAIPAEELPGRTDTNPRLERPAAEAAEAAVPAEETEVAEPEMAAMEAEPAPPVEPSPTPSPLRQAASAIRVDTIWKRRPAMSVGANALHLDPETNLVRDAESDGEREDTVIALVRPIEAAQAAAGVETDTETDTDADTDADAEKTTTVVDPDETEVIEAPEPVVGPQLAAARTRLGLSVSSLAARTRIRPHVIESIEVDDFAPCGGDFYARGHLRTLARVLGMDAAPLLKTYDERYAGGPIDPRTVFAGQLASGSTGTLRTMRGGPNWSVLVAAVMAVVLLWSVARLVMDSKPHEPEAAISLGSGSIGGNPYAKVADPVPVTVTAAGGGAHVVIRDARGRTVFTGDLPFGGSKTVKAAPPVRLQTSDGSLEVSIDGGESAALGKTGKSAQRTFTAGN